MEWLPPILGMMFWLLTPTDPTGLLGESAARDYCRALNPRAELIVYDIQIPLSEYAVLPSKQGVCFAPKVEEKP